MQGYIWGQAEYNLLEGKGEGGDKSLYNINDVNDLVQNNHQPSTVC